MKKVTAKMFFTVLWSGVCQAVKWFFGLFSCQKCQKVQEENPAQQGHESKENQGESDKSESCGKLLAIVITVAVVIVGLFMVGHWDEWYENFRYQFNFGKKLGDPWNTYVYDSIFFHEKNNGKGYLYNGYTGKKTLKHVSWVDDEVTEEPLVLFSDGERYGYLKKKKQGKWLLPQSMNAHFLSRKAGHVWCRTVLPGLLIAKAMWF